VQVIIVRATMINASYGLSGTDTRYSNSLIETCLIIVLHVQHLVLIVMTLDYTCLFAHYHLLVVEHDFILELHILLLDQLE
jgi:hypothetical protein